LEKRIEWDDLPASLKDAISARTGPVISGRAATDGQNSPLAAVLDTRDGKVFVKGLPSGHRLIVTQAREAAAAPLAKGLSPELLWQFDEDGWNVNGFEYIDGRKANYQPGSPDIGPVADLMAALSRIEIPPGPGPWKPITTRLRTYVDDPADGLIFAGQHLTHTDWMPDNVLIAGGRAWLVDWAWATPAQSWIDQGFWVIRLIANGHTITEAEAIAARLPAYAAADPAHLAVFARASRKMWDEIEASRPVPWTQTMAAAARAWAGHREHPGALRAVSARPPGLMR
jgi:hypothetical protein